MASEFRPSVHPSTPSVQGRRQGENSYSTVNCSPIKTKQTDSTPEDLVGWIHHKRIGPAPIHKKDFIHKREFMIWQAFFLALFLFVYPTAALTTISMEAAVTTTHPHNLVVVGLNGALQKRFLLKNQGGSLTPGAVHRASRVEIGIGGKGQDAAIALKCLGAKPKLLQFLGQGPEGDTVHKLLQDQLGAESVDETTIRVASPLRTCTSIVGKDETTELVEPSGIIQASELQQLLVEVCERKYSKTASSVAAAGICLMGSMPPGCPSDTYAQVYDRLADANTYCLMDSVAGLPAMLANIRSPTLLKINIHELRGLVGNAGSPASSSDNNDNDDDTSRLIAAFCNTFAPPRHLQALAITNGKETAQFCYFTEDSTQAQQPWILFNVPIPNLGSSSKEQTLYPIGAGDAVAAGTLAAWVSTNNTQNETNQEPTLPEVCQSAITTKLQELSIPTIPDECKALLVGFSFGLACGSASCLQTENSVLDVNDVLRLFKGMELPTVLE